MKHWADVKFDVDLARALASQVSIPLPIASVLGARGISTASAVECFITPRLSTLSDPMLLPDMQKAVSRVWRAVTGKERIAIYGDYDADGVTSTALLTTVLSKLGANVVPFLPHRMEEGYGLSVAGMKRCVESCKPSLIITVDCGTSSADTVRTAAATGIDVVVTDHHELSGELSPAVAVVNPKRGGPAESANLAGVGVVFKFCHALLKHVRDEGPKPADVDLRDYLDLLAIGTVADVVPLTGENRILVRHGLQRINKTENIGLRALIDVAGLKQTLDCYHLGFAIGPRLNAAGRLASATAALDLLLTDSPDIAAKLAKDLDVANSDRRTIEDRIRFESEEEIDAYYDPRKVYGIVCGRTGWHIGTVGIVASRLCKHYERPAIVIGFDEDGLGKGSCRSTEDFDIVDALRECSHLLVKFGGHKMAAGLEIEQANFDAFRAKFGEVCAERMRGRNMQSVLKIDAWVGLGEVDDRLYKALQQLQPMGTGNPVPTFAAHSVRVVGEPRIVGKSHLKMQLACGGSQLDAIAFGMGETKVPEGDLDIAFQVQENTYMGRTKLQLLIKDFRSGNVR